MNLNGKEGQWFDMSDTESFGLCAEVSAVPMGRVVVDGAQDNTCRLPDKDDILGGGSTTGKEPIGFSIYEEVPTDGHAVNAPASPIGWETTGNNYHNITDPVSVGSTGRYYARPENDILKGGKVFYRVAIDGSDPLKQSLGTIRGDDDGGSAVEWKGARFILQDSLAGGCAVLDLGKVYAA